MTDHPASVRIDPNLPESWREALAEEFGKPYFQQLKNFLLEEKAKGAKVFPPGPLIFNAFYLTPLENIKVVILGQDPYHGNGQAHGLSFSVPDGVVLPPSLRNIFKEYATDLGKPAPLSGDLTHWAESGVLLLNAILTVRAGEAASHQKKGWEEFTDAVIRIISERSEGMVFILWGAFAGSKSLLIDQQKHCILRSAHPSPLAAHNGFFGSKPFSKANEWLRKRCKEEVEW